MEFEANDQGELVTVRHRAGHAILMIDQIGYGILMQLGTIDESCVTKLILDADAVDDLVAALIEFQGAVTRQ
jgi:hypothetical protein